MDEIRAPVLDPGRKRTKSGYLWAIARDDRPWAGPDPPAVAYLYAPGRGAEHAIRPLAGFTGVLQVDAYAAYQALAEPARAGGPVTLAYCWSHVRRRFYEIAQGGNAPVAEAALQRIAALYRIESTIRGDAPERRRTVRHDQSRSIVAELRAWLATTLAKLPRRSRTAEAIRYALKLWSGLTIFLDDGRVEIDSNTVERAIRPIALNRKNALFARSDRDLQAQRGRPPGLSRRRPQPPRQPTSRQPNRPAHALGLRQPSGLKTALTSHRDELRIFVGNPAAISPWSSRLDRDQCGRVQPDRRSPTPRIKGARALIRALPSAAVPRALRRTPGTPAAALSLAKRDPAEAHAGQRRLKAKNE